MKKCRKIIPLIYKKADGIITEKENEILENHIDSCKNCKEEYKLILMVKEELKNSEYAPLPENFKAALHDKLVNHNLSEPSKIPFYKKIPINIIATACLAIGITIFALNTNVDKINSHTGNEAMQSEDSFGNEAITYQDENLKMRSLEAEPVQESKAVTVTEEKDKKPSYLPDNVSENLNNSINSEVLSDANTEPLTTASEDVIGSSGGGGGGGGSLPVEKNYITIKVSLPEKFLKLIPSSENNIYYIPIEKLDEVKEKLKDYIISVENETEETKNAEKFIIELK